MKTVSWDKLGPGWASAAAKLNLMRDTLPAFPKPHIRPIGGGQWECTRHVFHDEFISAQGGSASQAYDLCELGRLRKRLDAHRNEVSAVLACLPDWADRYAEKC